MTLQNLITENLLGLTIIITTATGELFKLNNVNEVKEIFAGRKKDIPVLSAVSYCHGEKLIPTSLIADIQAAPASDFAESLTA